MVHFASTIFYLIISLSFMQKGLEGSGNSITFYVAADTHYGKNDEVNALNESIIESMNKLPGSPYPDSVTGCVDSPLALVICGDLTDKGTAASFQEFDEDYGLRGEKKLAFPVFEGFGNHDGPVDGAIRNAIKTRNSLREDLISFSEDSLHYSWNWKNIHLIQLNSYPGSKWDPECEWCHFFKESFKEPQQSLDFLRSDLKAKVGDFSQPVMLFFHYGFDDWGNKWWTTKEQDAFYEVIKDYNILAIFHGHTHEIDHYFWKGIPVWCAGSTQKEGGPGEFLVVKSDGVDMSVGVRSGDSWSEYYFLNN